ncbi:MAG: choice-of-anchor D domain-containing protein [Bacteroidota bacterium]
MKRLAVRTCVIFSALFVAIMPAAFSQTISYIIPDIGTPGMNTYVEVIGPHDMPGNFGADGFWPNNPGDNLRLECVNPADSAKLIIGPLVVSWNGRMISAQVFINPDLLPNSDSWQAIAPQFVIPLQVRYNGATQNSVTFYIVRPQPAIITSANGSLGSGGVWGLRSPSGAIIVDSLELLGSSYGISMADCDPGRPGNQGYLPATIISKGPVRTGSSTQFTVDANTKHGGPGGGGGGGSFCDFTGSGSDGGDGFTGGGRGGRNRSGNPTGSDEYRNPGLGSGAYLNNTGGSLNGIQGGSAPAHEASGGGTGHPFGTSGDGCSDGSGCNPPGGFGAGSGQQQKQAGGAGGYATAGASSRNGNGGQVHGNEFIVPFAGGSGGASGNPQLAFSCSGDGGGGGGAVTLYARQLDGYLFTANGGDGANGSSGDGGAGSGGAVLLESKLPSGIWKIRAEGGNGPGPHGGGGRIRMDGPIAWTSGGLPAEESMAVGPSTDTTMFVKKSFTLTGTGDNADIHLFLKSALMPWTEIGVVSGYSTSWTFDIDIPVVDNVYYLVAMQEVSNPATEAFTARPVYVMSQSAANILISRTAPEILAESSRVFPGIACDNVALDTMLVSNIGEGILTIGNAGFAPGGRGFEIIEPAGFPVSVNPGESLRFITRFTRQPGQRGVITDSLMITSNSPAASPLYIAHSIMVDVPEMSASISNLVLPYVVICEGASSEASFEITNTGTIPLQLLLPVIDNPAFVLASPSPGVWPLTLQPGATMPIQLRVTHTTPGSLSGNLTFTADPDGCDYTTNVTLFAVSRDFSLSVSDIPAFPILRCSDESADTDFLIENDGDLSFIVTTLTSSDPSVSIISPIPPFPLTPGASQQVQLRFAPQSPGTFNGNVRVGIDGCGIQVDRPFAGLRDSIGLQLTPVDFGLQRAGVLPVMRQTRVTNTGSVAVTIASAVDVPPFRIVGGLPVSLTPGSSVDLTVIFDDPGTDGDYTAGLLLQQIPACAETILDVRGIRGSASVDLVVDTLSGMPGQTVEIPIYLRNAQNISLFGATGIRATLHYRSSLLVPLGQQQGTLVGEERLLDITIPLLTDANDVALRIPMMITLGNAEETGLLLTDIVPVGGDLTVNATDGHFTLLGICRDGGVRLFDGSTLVQLKQNRPNPFNPATQLEFVLIERGHTALQIYNSVGRLVATLVDETLEPGVHSRTFDASGLTSGVYVAVLRTPTVIKQRRMLLVK